jgi:hypothetical protein
LLCTTAYSPYLYLPYIACLMIVPSIRNLRTRHAVATRDPFNQLTSEICVQYYKPNVVRPTVIVTKKLDIGPIKRLLGSDCLFSFVAS